jgi:hypothetical protein
VDPPLNTLFSLYTLKNLVPVKTSDGNLEQRSENLVQPKRQKVPVLVESETGLMATFINKTTDFRLLNCSETDVIARPAIKGG